MTAPREVVMEDSSGHSCSEEQESTLTKLDGFLVQLECLRHSVYNNSSSTAAIGPKFESSESFGISDLSTMCQLQEHIGRMRTLIDSGRDSGQWLGQDILTMVGIQDQVICMQDQLIQMLVVMSKFTIAQKVQHGSSQVAEQQATSLPPARAPSRRRGAISSECVQAVLPSASITKVVVPKTEQQRQDLKDALQNSLLFSDIHDEDLNSLVEAFTPERCSMGTFIMRQGDNGDKFYIVARGTCDVLISKDGGMPSTVCTVSEYGGFGELALMYDAPRAATVVARSDCELWSLDRRTFQTVLMVAITNRRRQYQHFLASVPILAKVTWEERAKIADVMEAKWFEDGEYIIEQGEEGDRIYFIEVGEAVATKSFVSGQAPRQVMSYSKGDYFGELALIRNEPRAANVVAKGRCKVCAIDKPSFVRLLGPCLEIMNRQIDFYEMHECTDMEDLTIDDFDLNESIQDSRMHAPAPPFLPLPNKRRGAVSATPAVSNQLDRHTIPSFPKSSGASGRLKSALRCIILFAHLEQEEVDSVVDAFFEVQKKMGETIITQGEDGDNFYIVDAGECEVYISSKTGRRLVCVAGQGDSFGELALMYNCPRAATVVARTDVLLFALSQEVFTLILRSSAQDRRAQYDAFLQRVPILQGLTAEERGKIADVLVQTSFKDGEVIIQERDAQANTFYIQFQGEAVAIKCNSHNGTSKVVMHYAPGDYYGEMALIKNIPRSASVVAKGDCKVLSIDRHAFTRLLGPCAEILARQMDQYQSDQPDSTLNRHVTAQEPSDMRSGPHSRPQEPILIQQPRLIFSMQQIVGSSLSASSTPTSAWPSSARMTSAHHAVHSASVLAVHPKRAGANSRLQAAVRRSALLAHLEQEEVDSVVDAFFEVQKKMGETIITQGEDGDNFYIVDAGECEVYISSKTGRRLVCVAGQGDSFGELALMYNCPRAATVVARTDVLLFALSQEVFTLILRSSAQDRRVQYDAFLQRVPILQGLTAEERGKIADVLVQTSFKDGEVIVAQGDVADSFFIMADGAAAAYVEWEEGDKTLRRRELCRYGKGDFFGERGLLGGTGRLATVVSVGGCAALRMDRAAFLRLVGWMHGVADKQYPVHVPGLWPQPR